VSETAVRVLRWLFLVASVLIVAASDAVQLFIIGMLVDYLGDAPGETRAYAGMGIVAVTIRTLLLTLPGALLAIGFTVRSAVKYRRLGTGIASLIFFGGSTMIAVVFVALFIATG
jgi:hypothetical protein